MPIDQFSLLRFRPIANHEAGHYIVATQLGFKPGDLTLNIVNPTDHSANSSIELNIPLRSVDEIVEYCENRIQVLYAGAIAESLTDGEIVPTKLGRIWQEGGKSDFEKIKELLRILRNLRFPESNTVAEIDKNLADLADELINRAGAIVEENAALIEGIGGRLHTKLREYNTTYILASEEIAAIPNFRAKFIEINDATTSTQSENTAN